MVDRRITFPDLSSRAYEHPADRSALVALRKVPGFAEVIKTVAGIASDRSFRLRFLASGVKVSERQFTGMNRLFLDSVAVLDLPAAPELFVIQNAQPNAMTVGMDAPFVVVTTGMLDLLDEEELRQVLGHELGHALSGHALYHTMLLQLTSMSLGVAWLPGGYAALWALVTALREWYRKSELSADRAGLLAGQDPDVTVRLLMKMAGGTRLSEMDPEAFLEQAAEYETGGDMWDSVLKLKNLVGETHPFPVLRAAAIRSWVASGDYERILTGDYPRRHDDPQAGALAEMKAAAREYKSNLDNSVDPLMKFLRGAADEAGKAGGAVFDRFRRGGG